jgi:hypothetical protein
MLPIPQHGLFKELPTFVTIYTPNQSRSHACMMNGCQGWRISRACIGQELPLFPSTFVHHLAQPERLSIIVWLLHCSSLAVCAKNMGCLKALPDCCHEHLPLCPTAYLRVTYTYLLYQHVVTAWSFSDDCTTKHVAWWLIQFVFVLD